MARYLITGGAGFIGSHLAERLLAGGHFVQVLDDLSSGRSENVPAGAELIAADVTDPDAVQCAFEGIDGCFHLAAIASVERCRKQLAHSNAVNLGGTITVFEEAVRAQAHRGRPVPVIYASSAAVYGNPDETPISEGAPPRPENSYGLDKLCCEMHAAVIGRSNELRVAGLRFFNVYGPRQSPDSPYSGVISIFCERTVAGEPIDIHGDGSQIRDFIYVDDVVAALLRAMDAVGPVPHVFNISTGVGTSISQLGRAISQILGCPFEPRYVPPRTGDIRVSIGAPAHARNVLGFAATVPLSRGLARTLEAMMACSGPRVKARQSA